MEKNYYLIAIIIFVIIAAIITRFTYKKYRGETGRKMRGFGTGNTNYWSLVSLSSFLITTIIMLLLKCVEFI